MINARKSALGLKRLVCGVIVVMMLASLVSLNIFSVSAAEEISEASKLEEIKELLNTPTYSNYIELNTKEYVSKNGKLPLGTDRITIDGATLNSELSHSSVKPIDSYEGKTGKFVETSNEGAAVFNFTVKSEGLYNIALTAIAIPGKKASIERSILIDGRTPFKEARDITIQKLYIDDFSDAGGNSPDETVFRKDIKGNEIRPKKLEILEWQTLLINDSSGYTNEPLYFYLTEGEHTIHINSIREPMVIGSVEIYVADKLKTYEEYKKEYASAGAGSAKIETIQAEIPDVVSDIGIYAINDRTSAITQPQDTSRIKLNAIGSEPTTQKWQLNGQWIRWTMEVPAGGSGFYYIIPRFKQNKYAGVYSSRKIKIDGEVPFAEANYLRFNFSDDWQTAPFNDGTTQFEFYLSEGKHVIELEVVLGTMADVLRRVDASLLHLNNMYKKIHMITGTAPDIYADYGFEKTIPDVLEGMDEESNNLYAFSKELEDIIGAKGEHTVILDKVALQLRKMADDTDKIASGLGTLKTNIGGLATWLLDRKYQPLELDYIAFQSPTETKMPQAEANFFQAFAFEMSAFFMSFFSDYSSLGSSTETVSKNDEVNVWLATGRDQAQILRQMIDDDFTSAFNIPTTVKLVAAGSLLPATLAGTGPDVSVFTVGSEAINYAIRSAVLPLNEFKGDASRGIAGFDEVTTWFNPSAITPLTLHNDKEEDKSKLLVFGLPENQTFPMMFYRKDILADLNLEVPKTWDDLYNIVPVLQKRNLEVGVTPGLGTQQIFMYQQKEPMYKGDGYAINLDSNIALDAFKKMCELYTIYKFPVEYDFANRFRSGEMPIGIASYEVYNNLTVFATEIKGMWEFAPLPGTIRDPLPGDEDRDYERTADGKVIDNDSPGTVTCIMMMKTAEKRNKENTWAFMQWWVSAGAQSRYGNEMVALMGPAAKQPTANIEALAEMPWITSDYKSLSYQFQHLTGTPEVPGGYIVTRNVEFARLEVYNNGKSPVETILDYILPINKELTRKRQEFTRFDFRIEEPKKLGERKAKDDVE